MGKDSKLILAQFIEKGDYLLNLGVVKLVEVDHVSKLVRVVIDPGSSATLSCPYAWYRFDTKLTID